MFTTKLQALTMPLGLLMLAMVWPHGAHAAINLLSQSRSVSATATLGCGSLVDSSSSSTVAAGIFNQSVSEFIDGAESNASGATCIGLLDSFSSSASQNTEISTVILQGNGATSAGKGGGALETGLATGNSLFTASFQVTTPTSYQLFGQVDGVGVNASFTGYFPGNATVSLAMGSTTIHSVSPNPPDIFGDGTLNAFAFSGVLAPGVYSLNASASASASGSIESYDSSRFAFTFVPEPGIPT